MKATKIDYYDQSQGSSDDATNVTSQNQLQKSLTSQVINGQL